MLIPYADFKHSVPPAGQQVRINHDRCTAGADTRARLYVKNDGDAVMAYCHNCSGHNVRRAHRGVRHADLVKQLLHKADVAEATATEVVLPADTVLTPDQFSGAARAWLYQYQMSDAEIVNYQIGYSPSWGRVTLPVYNDNKLVFWQGRNVDGGSGPKYVSVKSAKKPLFTAHGNKHPAGAIITEDMLSAIAATRTIRSYWNGVALLGLHDADSLSAELDSYRVLVVWLDPDVPGRRKSVELAQRLRLLCPDNTALFRSTYPKEPKQCSAPELAEGLSSGHCLRVE